ncbi:hypothetical protein HK098_002395 [Nowakowskiella sp. JEL0407]|nr:hypothetical protein HK098_002395 [Nowakowskiella sp. JEL0407]
METEETCLLSGHLTFSNKQKTRNPFTNFSASQRIHCKLYHDRLICIRTDKAIDKLLPMNHLLNNSETSLLKDKNYQVFFQIREVIGCIDALVGAGTFTVFLIDRSRGNFSTLNFIAENSVCAAEWATFIHQTACGLQSRGNLSFAHNYSVADPQRNRVQGIMGSRKGSMISSGIASLPTEAERSECWQALLSVDEIPLYCANPNDLFIKRVAITHSLLSSTKLQQRFDTLEDDDSTTDTLETNSLPTFGVALLCVGKTVLRFFPCSDIEDTKYLEVIDHITMHVTLPLVGISQISTQGRNSEFIIDITRKGPNWTQRERSITIRFASTFRDEIINELRSVIRALRPGWPHDSLFTLDIPFSLRNVDIEPKFDILRQCGSDKLALSFLMRVNTYLFSVGTYFIHFRIKVIENRRIFILLPPKFQTSQVENPRQYSTADIAIVFESLKFTSLVQEISFSSIPLSFQSPILKLFSHSNTSHNFTIGSRMRRPSGYHQFLFTLQRDKGKNKATTTPPVETPAATRIGHDAMLTLLYEFVKSIPNVSGLNFANCYLTLPESNISILNTVFKALQSAASNLQHLDLSNNPLLASDVEIAKAIMNLRNPMVTLVLRGTGISKIDEILLALGNRGEFLETFDVGMNGSHFSDRSLYFFLKKVPRLRKLFLQGCVIMALVNDGEEFDLHLANTIEVIDLSNVVGLNTTRVLSIKVLTTYISNEDECQSLTVLKLKNTNLNGFELSKIFQGVTHSRVKDTLVLDVSSNPLSREGWDSLCYALGESEGPRSIVMQDIHVEKSEQLGQFFTCLSTNKRLVKLDLCGFGWKGSLAGYANNNQSQESFVLSCNSLGSVFATNTTLRELLLRGERFSQTDDENRPIISDTWGKHLTFALQILRVNRTLEVLDVRGHGFQDTGAIALADALRQNLCLKVLECDQNEIGIEGLVALSAALTSNSNLVYFPFPIVDGNKVEANLLATIEDSKSQALLIVSIPKNDNLSTGKFLLDYPSSSSRISEVPSFSPSTSPSYAFNSTLSQPGRLKSLKYKEKTARKSLRSLYNARVSFKELIERNREFLSLASSSNDPTTPQNRTENGEISKLKSLIRDLVDRNERLRQMVYDYFHSSNSTFEIDTAQSEDASKHGHNPRVDGTSEFVEDGEIMNLSENKVKDAILGFIEGKGVIWEMPWTCDLLSTALPFQTVEELFEVVGSWYAVASMFEEEMVLQTPQNPGTMPNSVMLVSVLGDVLRERDENNRNTFTPESGDVDDDLSDNIPLATIKRSASAYINAGDNAEHTESVEVEQSTSVVDSLSVSQINSENPIGSESEDDDVPLTLLRLQHQSDYNADDESSGEEEW